MKSAFKSVAVFGFISKGFVYFVMGILSFLAAMNLGGESSGTNQALLFVKKQPLGQVLLLGLGFGLLCYSFWMFFQSIKDPEGIGSDLKGKSKRFGLFTTGLVYTVVASLTFYHFFSKTPDQGSGPMYQILVDAPTLSMIFIGIGCILGIQAIILIIGVFKGGLLAQFNLEGRQFSGLVKKLGQFGFYSRAFIVGILAYFFIRSGTYAGSHEIKGIEDAFSFLEHSPFGSITMGFTAMGFVSYGLFYILLSKYRNFEDE